MGHEEIAPDFESGPLEELTQVLPAANGADPCHVVLRIRGRLLRHVGCRRRPRQTGQTVKEQAHDLKGISGTFGAKRLQQLSGELEHLAFDQESACVPAMLEAMKRTSVSAKIAIEKALAVSAAA